MRRRTAAALILAAATALVPGLDVRAADDHEPGPWEEVVFLPESGLSVLLERDPRGVLLERGDYLDLYRRARAAGRAGSGDISGIPSGVLRCDVDGIVEGDVETENEEEGAVAEVVEVNAESEDADIDSDDIPVELDEDSAER